MRNKCRYCGAERKDGVVWYDDDYCSGKCRKADGEVVEPQVEREKKAGKVATLEDYLLDYPKNLGQKNKTGERIRGRIPKLYRRRYEPEKLNWGEPLTNAQLKQAGFRANRVPLPGDWDFIEDKDKQGGTENAG